MADALRSERSARKGVLVQVQFGALWKGKPMGDGTRLEPGRGESPWEFNSPLFRHGGSSRSATASGLNPDERKPCRFNSCVLRYASMVKQADAPGSNPGGPEGSCRFKSCCSHRGR